MTLKTTGEAFALTIRQHKGILLIVGIGFLARLFYTVFLSSFVAQHYFGQESAFANTGDFAAWTASIKNLIHTGSYTVNPDNDYGYFGRMPGYAVFIAPFYLLFGEQYFTYALSFAQLLLDTLNIYLIYEIVKRLLPSGYSACIAAVIFALNPINIIWSSALFSEGLSVFILILSVYLYTCSSSRYKYLWIGLLSGFNILVRPQLMLFVLSFAIVLLVFSFQHRSKKEFTGLCLFCLGTLLTYAPWPARNYILHDKLVLTQDISGFAKWGIDVHSYLHYIVSIQSNWEPQFSQIIHNRPFQIDKQQAYAAPTDSADLARAIFLSQHYGSGFSSWPGYWKEKVERNRQDTTIVELFSKLQKNQMKYNPLHYWVTLPLANLKKCLFKLDFTRSDPSLLFRMASFMFVLRTLIILIGLAGAVLLLKEQELIFKVILLFFTSWYILICWGPSAQMRNIEMRYLLQVDTLIIIPAAYLIDLLFKNKSVISILTLKAK